MSEVDAFLEAEQCYSFSLNAFDTTMIVTAWTEFDYQKQKYNSKIKATHGVCVITDNDTAEDVFTDLYEAKALTYL